MKKNFDETIANMTISKAIMCKANAYFVNQITSLEKSETGNFNQNAGFIAPAYIAPAL